MPRNLNTGEAPRTIPEVGDALTSIGWQHTKTGGFYRVLTTALREADLAPLVVYTNEDGVVFTRPAAEFFDGRFVPIVFPKILRIETDTNEKNRLNVEVGWKFATMRENSEVVYFRRKLFYERATTEIQRERLRQVEEEGFTPERDDRYSNGELWTAARCYYGVASGKVFPAWPWDEKWWKPTTPARNLIKAGALCLAEKARLRRNGIALPLGETLLGDITRDLALVLEEGQP